MKVILLLILGASFLLGLYNYLKNKRIAAEKRLQEEIEN